MKKSLPLIILILICFHGFAQNFQWAKSAGGKPVSQGLSMTVDTFGNTYTTGFFYDTVDFDPGPGVYNLISAGYEDIFISKLDANGNFVWAKRIGGANGSPFFINDYGCSINLDVMGNIFITGYFMDTVDFDPNIGIHNLVSLWYDLFILKLDSTGNFMWVKSTGMNNNGHTTTIDHTGSICVVGAFSGNVDFDPGPSTFYLNSGFYQAIFILKLDSSGNFLWAKSMRSQDDNAGIGIAVDDSNNIYTTGYFTKTVDLILIRAPII